jgi:23S rRNA-/tRNA-specific pseudouridylate synthase
MASIGHPLAGDPLYGKRTGQETMGLHAWKLSLQKPFGPERIEIAAQLPDWAAFYKGEPETDIFGKPFV